MATDQATWGIPPRELKPRKKARWTLQGIVLAVVLLALLYWKLSTPLSQLLNTPESKVTRPNHGEEARPDATPNESKDEGKRNPEPAKPPWATRFGTDNYGTWAEFEVNGVKAVLRWIPAGSFMMGSPAKEVDRYDDEKLHRVTLTQGFWMGETEVTQALWQAVMGANPSNFKGPDLPVEMVSWDDTAAFLEKLNRLVPGLALRLPMEAEWEYACRAGTTTPFSFGEAIDSRQVNFNGNYPYANGPKSEYRAKTAAVKSLPANDWGLHEMHGNVQEWCADFLGPYSEQAVVDPRGSATGAERVLRGGSWGSGGRFARAACRDASEPGRRYQDCGFRLARGQDPAF